MEPATGVEPVTCRLRIGCSTTKLRWQTKTPRVGANNARRKATIAEIHALFCASGHRNEIEYFNDNHQFMTSDLDEICLYAVGLMSSTEAEQFEAKAAGDQELNRQVVDFEDTALNLLGAWSPRVTPREGLRRRILSVINKEPALVLTDRQGYILGVNEAFTAMCGHLASDVIGRKPGHFLRGPETCPKASEALSSAIREGREVEQAMINYHRNGSAYHVHIRLIPLRSAEGQIAGFAAIERVTEPALVNA